MFFENVVFLSDSEDSDSSSDCSWYSEPVSSELSLSFVVVYCEKTDRGWCSPVPSLFSELSDLSSWPSFTYRSISDFRPVYTPRRLQIYVMYRSGMFAHVHRAECRDTSGISLRSMTLNFKSFCLTKASKYKENGGKWRNGVCVLLHYKKRKDFRITPYINYAYGS